MIKFESGKKQTGHPRAKEKKRKKVEEVGGREQELIKQPQGGCSSKKKSRRKTKVAAWPEKSVKEQRLEHYKKSVA